MLSPHLRSHTPLTLAAEWPELELEGRLARRVVSRLVHNDRDDLDDVPGLSKAKAAGLLERGSTTRLEVLDRRRSPVDLFVKYLFRSADGSTFEAVRIPLLQPRWSVCVSSQVGCAMACTFCETGRLGLRRHLEPWEIVEQVLTVQRESPERPVTGVVFQGQGEPFHAYDSVIRAAEVLRDPCGGRIRGDRMTISTVGVLPMIDRYTREGHPYRLMLSLASAFDEKRARLVPLGRVHEVGQLAEAMRRHALARRQPVAIAWVLLGGVNSQPEEMHELARHLAGVPVRLSVIDVNDETGDFRRATDDERRAFFAAAASHGFAIHRRYSGGPDIHAACGMLSSSHRGGDALSREPEDACA